MRPISKSFIANSMNTTYFCKRMISASLKELRLLPSDDINRRALLRLLIRKLKSTQALLVQIQELEAQLSQEEKKVEEDI